VDPDFLPNRLRLFGHVAVVYPVRSCTAILVSTRRIAFAFLLASALALPLGVLMGSFDPINRFFEPIVARFAICRFRPLYPSDSLVRDIRGAEDRISLPWGLCVFASGCGVGDSPCPEELVQTALTLGASDSRSLGLSCYRPHCQRFSIAFEL